MIKKNNNVRKKKEKDPPYAVVAMQFIACLSEKKKNTPNEDLRSADITMTGRNFRSDRKRDENTLQIN